MSPVAEQVVLAIADGLASAGTDGCGQPVLALIVDSLSVQTVGVGTGEEPQVHSS